MPAPYTRASRSSVGERYRVLLDIGRTLAGTLSLDELYAAIHLESARVLEASGFYVSLYDAGRDEATVVYFADRGDQQRPGIVFPGSRSEVLRTGKPVLVRDGLDGRSILHLGAAESDVTRSAISAPLVHKGRLLGAISAQSYEADAYDEEDLDLLQGIADLSAVAMENASHVAELERRRREAEQIEEIGRALTSSLDAKVVLGKVIRAALDILNVDGASVWLCDGPSGRIGRVAESDGEIALPLGLSWDFDGPIAERLIQGKEPVVLDDLASSPLVPDHLRSHLESGSGMGTPLFVGGNLVGILTAGSRRPRHFTDDDTAVLQRLASQASVALENARLHANLQALSLSDPLTGLPNRRRLQIHLDKEVAAARRGRALVVVVFDLDDFKIVNDTKGHLAGDDILRAFAQILDEENRAMNLVSRYGGDEFVSILSDTGMDGARPYIKRVVDRVAHDPIMSSMGVSVSIGLAEFDRASMKTMDDIIAAADSDMYRVKAKRQKARRAASS
ncbi:MAG: sensor domain-containing diguanylate cyclase [Longimicrobiales bacterium]